MADYTIKVNEVEELQMIQNIPDLEQIFARAKSVVNQGGTVTLSRETADGSTIEFDALTTETDLEAYRQTVFKYL